MSFVRRDTWALGANNVAPPERLPEGFARDLVNLDPAAGALNLRASYSQVVGGWIRVAVGLGDRVVLVREDHVECYWPATNSVELLGSIDSDGPVAGVAFNGYAYLSTAQSSFRTDGRDIEAWAVPSPGFWVELIDGDLPPGLYKVACTADGAVGESGTDSLLVSVAQGQALRVTSPESRPLRVYVSVANGSTLYSQGLLVGGARAITTIEDDTEQLVTDRLIPMPHCSFLAAYHATILGVHDRMVVFSVPHMPHLVDPLAGFVQYPEPPSMIAPTDAGVYVAAGNRTYFITDIESSTPSQRVVLEVGAVSGSAVLLPDGRAAWFTRYGQAIGDPMGNVSLPNQNTYAPDLASQGAAGVLEHQGNQMVVTTMRGNALPNGMAAGDFAELETDYEQ